MKIGIEIKKGIVISTTIVLGATVLMGCGSTRSKDVNDIAITKDNIVVDSTDGQSSENASIQNSESSKELELIDKLPDNQQDQELDKLLAEMRKQKKDGFIVVDGEEIYIEPNGSDLPGQSKNIPDRSDESLALDESFFSIVFDYLENELKLQKPENGYNVGSCYDPRINALYDDEDKGVVEGYENNDIAIIEYETEALDVYSYLFLVCDSSDGTWRVIHQGDSYKN